MAGRMGGGRGIGGGDDRRGRLPAMGEAWQRRWDARKNEDRLGGGERDTMPLPPGEKRSLRWKEQGRRSALPPGGWDGAVPTGHRW